MKMELSDKQVMIILVTILILIYVPFILSNQFQGYSFLKGDMVYHEYFIQSILQDHDWYIANNTRGQDPLSGNWSHFSNRYLMTTVALSSVFVSNFIEWIAYKKFPLSLSANPDYS